MPRPCCVRKIASEIKACSIVPFMEDAQLARQLFGGADVVVLEPDEVEALRLADIENLYQEEAAKEMGISRQTFGRIVDRVHKKVADALLNGKALIIQRAKAPCLERPPFASSEQSKVKSMTGAPNEIQSMEEQSMKIAFISDDGITISQHFGRAMYYVVLTIENGKVTNKEQRPKLGHNHFAGQHEEHHEHDVGGAGHGFDHSSQERHVGMLQAVSDCKVLVAGGMGAGAYASMQSAGIEPIVSDMRSIDDAAAAYIAGTLENHMEYLH